MFWFSDDDDDDDDEEDEAADEDEGPVKGRITAIKPPLLARGSMSPHIVNFDVRKRSW
jgi:hypothetical protein